MEELLKILYGKYAKDLSSDEVKEKIKYALTLDPDKAIDSFYVKYTDKLPTPIQKETAIGVLKQNTSNYIDKSKPKIKSNIFESIGIGLKNVYKGYAAYGPMMSAGKQITNLNKKINFINNNPDSNSFLVGGYYSQKEGYTIGAEEKNREEALEFYKEKIAEQEKIWFENFQQSKEIQDKIDKFEKAQIFKEGKDGLEFDLQLREIPQVVGEQLPQMLSSFFGATYFQEAGNVMERMLTKRAAEDLNLSEQEFMNLSSKEQGDAMFNIIKDGRAEDILDKSVRTGVINQGLDFAGAAVLVGKAAKFIPKDAWRRALKGNFKPIKKEIGSQAAGTGAEVGTEITQEINSAITAEDPITRELLLETAAQTIIGAGGVQTSIQGVSIAYNEGMSQYAAATDPKSVSALAKTMRKQIKEDTSKSENEKLDLLRQIDIAENLTRNSKFNNLSSEEYNFNGKKTNSKKLFFEQEIARQKTFDKIESLENQLKENPNDVDLEIEINETKLQLADIDDQMLNILIANNYIAHGSKLIEFVNENNFGGLKGKKIITRKNKEELLQYIKKHRPKDLKDKKIQEWLDGDNNGILAGDRKIAYIIEDRVVNNALNPLSKESKKGDYAAGNVVHHEVLHMLLDNLSPEKRFELKNEIDATLKESQDPQIQKIYKAIQERFGQYKDKSQDVQSHEYFAAISDVLSGLQALENIEQAGVFKRIGMAYSNKLKDFIGIADNINASNALELIKKHNAFNGLPVTKKEIIEAAASDIATVVKKGKTDIEKEPLESKLSNEVQQDIANEINNLQKARKEAEDLASKFNKPYQKTPSETKIENSIIEKVKPTVDSFVESRTKALYDPIAPDAKQDVDRSTFKETMKSDIHAMIFEEFKGLQNIEKFITNRGFLRANNLAQRLGIKSVEQGIDQKINEQTTQQIIQEEDIDPNLTDVPVKTINLAERLYNQDQLDQAKALIAQDERDLSTLSYATLGNITAPVTSQIFNVPAGKFTDVKSNLTKQEVINGRQAIIKNAKLILDTRPEGAVVEGTAVSKNLEGTSTGLSRGLLKSPLYKRQERGGKGAGLAPFVRNEAATIEDIINLVGKKGTPAIARSPQAQNIKSIIKMVDGAITNSLYRSETVLTPQQTTDVAAGKADALLSKKAAALAEDLQIDTYYELNENTILKYVKDFRKNVLPYFKDSPGLLNLGTVYNGILGKMKGVNREAVREKIKKELLKDKFWVKKGNGYTYGEDTNGVYTGGKMNTKKLIKLYKNKEKFSEEIEKINKITKKAWFDGWKSLFLAIENNVNNITTILHFLKNAVSEADHFHRKGAEFVGLDIVAIEKIIKGDKETTLEFEHALQNLNAFLEAIRIAYETRGELNDKGEVEISGLPDFIAELSILYGEYKLIAIDRKDNDKLNKAIYIDSRGEEKSFKNGMGRNWNIYNNRMIERYANLLVAEIDGGINFKNLRDAYNLDRNFEQKYNIKNDGTPLVALESQKSNLSQDLNDIIEQKKGAKFASEKRFSPKKAAMRGKKAEKGIMNFFIPYGAEDFQGLMYALLPKGDLGNKAMEWMRQNLFRPYGIAMENLSRERIAVMNDFKALKSKIKNIPKTLKKEILNGDYTIQDAVRVYIWNKQGMKIPGLTKTDETKLVNFVKKDKELTDFANQLITINKQEGYVKPDSTWDSGTITTDLFQNLNTVKRAKYLQKWQKNVDEIFTQENLNKLEAAFGPDYRNALENILTRMKTGTNRVGGGNKQVNAWLEWINNSVGVIMFLNVRSALLQMISTVNYINWSDNNPIKAAIAYGNQPQFWKDFKFIFNSDFLVERRGGLKLNINEAEIAEQANKKGVRGVISYLLNKGFILTRGADSFAIANGGATFYRNRINTYLKQGGKAKELLVYNASPRSFNELGKRTGLIYLATNKREASAYAKMNRGKVKNIYINENKVASEQDLINTMKELKIDTSEGSLYELIDSRFDFYIGKEAMNKVTKALSEKGFLAARYKDGAQVVSGKVESIVVFDKSVISDKKGTLKQGLSQKEAETKAFQDFRELTEEAQQSSRPDRISRQQASVFGRILLAFANTPMQYARLMKRGTQDLIAGRGDWKTNMSKVMYYGVIQNFIFNALQQALFAIGMGEEDDEKFNDNKTYGTMNGMLDSILRGTGVVGNAVAVGKNILIDIAKRSQRPRPKFGDAAWKLLDVSPPIDSKITKIRGGLYAFDNEMDKILDEGLSLDNPANLAIAQFISAGTNIPLDRVIRLFDNYRAAVAEDTEAWQRVALILGWSTWELEPEDDEGLRASDNKLKHGKLKSKTLKGKRKLK